MKITKRILPLLLCLAFLATPAVPVQAESPFDKSRAGKNVTGSYKKLLGGILAVYKNKTALKLTATVNFMDAAKKASQGTGGKNPALAESPRRNFSFPRRMVNTGTPSHMTVTGARFPLRSQSTKVTAKK